MNVERCRLLAALLAATHGLDELGTQQAKHSAQAADAFSISQRVAILVVDALAAVATTALGWFVTRRHAAQFRSQGSQAGCAGHHEVSAGAQGQHHSGYRRMEDLMITYRAKHA